MTSTLPRPLDFSLELLRAALRREGRDSAFHRRSLASALAECSARSLPIVLLVNLLVGGILAFVGAVQLARFGAGIFVADLVAIAEAREMAAIITAVVMAGRTGAAFAAELATMQTHEEVDALEVLGVRAVDFLVLPRVAALMLMSPLLYVFACAAALLGGMAVSASMLDLSIVAFVDRTASALAWTHLALGLVKSMAFGALVGAVACWHGISARRSASGVGEATTRAVVHAIVGIIVLDAAFALAANALGI